MEQENAPSKWAQRKAARAQMYASATDGVAAVKSRRRRNEPDPNAFCQKCLQGGHWTYECNNNVAAYKARPSSLQLLEQGSSKRKWTLDLPPDEAERRAKRENGTQEKPKKMGKAKAKSSSSSGSSGDESDSSSSSSSSSNSSSSSSSGSSSGSESSSSSSGGRSGSSSSGSGSESDSGSSRSGSSSSSSSGSPPRRSKKRR